MKDRAWSPFLLADFYKISHRSQYPKGTSHVYSTWIPRSTYIPQITEVVAFGFQGFIKEWLVGFFDEFFFHRPWVDVQEEYSRIIKHCLGDPDPDTSHLEYLWNLGHLPLEIRAVPEGTRVPLRVPMLTIENTDPECFWLTNAIESLFSAEVWQPSTSATIAAEYRRLLDEALYKTTGSTAGVGFQGHDFSMRGMAGVHAGAASGAGHLLSFDGTDTIPAILYAERYYNADVEQELVGTSIPATEHSVMCAHGQDELESFRYLINEVYPSGFVSIVSDTYDLWKIVTEVLPALKDDIMARDGRLVIRPDSGDPVDIICGKDYDREYMKRKYAETGDEQYNYLAPREKGVYELLWEIFGGTVNEQGYKVLDSHIGCIYGDAISLERCEQILDRLTAKGFAPTNMVFGIGSFSYQFQTRDTFGFALKSTWCRVNGEERQIFKDPATDTNKTKKSLIGRVVVLEDEVEGTLSVMDGLDFAAWDSIKSDDVMRPIFSDGKLLEDDALSLIRHRLELTRDR